MKVRTRLLLSLVLLIVLMTGAFFAVSRIYMESLFRQYAVAARLGEAQQWSALLSYYYDKNGQSWRNVSQYISQINGQNLSAGRTSGLVRIVLQDKRGRVVFISSSNHVSETEMLRAGVHVPIFLKRKTIGTITVFDRDLAQQSRLETRILRSMTKAAFIAAVATSVVALLLGISITGWLTRSLRLLMGAIQSISKGNLEVNLPIRRQDEFGQVAASFNTMARQLARTEQARRHLVADVAHELRTPLTIIQGQLELILQGVKPQDPTTLLPIVDECVRLTRLVDDLHQLSLAEAGVLPLEREMVDVDQLVRRVVDNFEFEAEDRGVVLQMSPENGLAESFIDARRITQVFVNLIGNALRYSPEGSAVYVSLAQGESFVKVSVQDSGPGISPDHLPHIFNRFYRVESDRSRDGGGMGLGLAIAKEYVEAHGGSIEVQSEMGRGTTFMVKLPRRAPAVKGK